MNIHEIDKINKELSTQEMNMLSTIYYLNQLRSQSGIKTLDEFVLRSGVIINKQVQYEKEYILNYITPSFKPDAPVSTRYLLDKTDNTNVHCKIEPIDNNHNLFKITEIIVNSYYPNLERFLAINCEINVEDLLEYYKQKLD